MKKSQKINYLFTNYLQKQMRKTKKNHNNIPDPYEDLNRLEQLDPYEALIKSNYSFKKNNKSNE